MEILITIFSLALVAVVLFFTGPWLIDKLVYMAICVEEKATEWRQIIDAIRGESGSNGKKPK